MFFSSALQTFCVVKLFFDLPFEQKNSKSIDTDNLVIQNNIFLLNLVIFNSIKLVIVSLKLNDTFEKYQLINTKKARPHFEIHYKNSLDFISGKFTNRYGERNAVSHYAHLLKDHWFFYCAHRRS